MRAVQGRRRTLALLVTCLLAAGSAAGLTTTLISCSAAGTRAGPARPLTAVEAGRLASMRLYNYQDGRSGVRGVFGQPGKQVTVAGWVDWQLPLAYLSVAGQPPGSDDGLVQAVPGMVAHRPGRVVTEPPVPAPADGWRVRQFAPTGPDGSPLDTMLALLFTVAVDRTDPAEPLARGEARWLRSDRVDGVPVDVLLGPAVPPSAGPGRSPEPSGPSPTPGTAGGGAVRYWLDSDARLRRLEAVVGADLPLRLDFARADRRELLPVAELGGRTVAPRRPTTAEAEVLARLRQRDRTVGGGTVSVVLPHPDRAPMTAAGWLDWRNNLVYLAVRDTTAALVRADRAGRWTLAGAAPGPDGRPPVPAPRGDWEWAGWRQRSTGEPAGDLDALLSKVVTMSSSIMDDRAEVELAATWLRADSLDGVPVAVFEIPEPAERGRPAGSARLRYWVDGSGVLRRLEVRMLSGGFGRLDVTLSGRVPYVAPPRTG